MLTMPSSVLRRRIDSSETRKAERIARKSNDNSASRLQCLLVMTSNQWRISCKCQNGKRRRRISRRRNSYICQKNPTSKEEQELEDCGHSVLKNWCGACVKARCFRKHLQVEPLEKEGRKRTVPSLEPFDCILRCDADTTLEFENEPNPEIFQEVKIIFIR